jgi:hypothetical protein
MSETETTETHTSLAPTTIKAFLETFHPTKQSEIGELWTMYRYQGGSYRRVIWPDIRLHCRVCEGERTFRCKEETIFHQPSMISNAHPDYTCGDCHQQHKQFALHVALEGDNSGRIYKYGELPPFGIPIPNRVLRLFGEDASVFLKGRQCENLGYGISAFAYYRRVVENHRNDLFEEIIKVSRTVGAPSELIDELQAAKMEISFSKSLDKIKSALPQGLLINGQNPLRALHSALSVGLHDEDDGDCLASARAVRLVLSDLVEKIAILKQDNKQLNDAMQLLLAKR